MSVQSVDLIRDKQNKEQLIPIPPGALKLAKRAYRRSRTVTLAAVVSEWTKSYKRDYHARR